MHTHSNEGSPVFGLLMAGPKQSRKPKASEIEELISRLDRLSFPRWSIRRAAAGQKKLI